MDMTGPLPEIPRGNKYIFAICGHFTKYTKTYAMIKLPRKWQKNALNSEAEYLNAEIPEAVLTDRGTFSQAR